MASLHDEDSPELGNAMVFLENYGPDSKMRHKPSRQIRGLKQRGRLVKEYVQEFWRVVGKLWYWPEQLLVYHFKNGLEKELHRPDQ